MLSPVSLSCGLLFFNGIIDTGDKFITVVVDTADRHSFAIISANFRKNSKQSQCDTQGPGDTDLWKNLKSKISCQTPFKAFPKRRTTFLCFSYMLLLAVEDHLTSESARAHIIPHTAKQLHKKIIHRLTVLNWDFIKTLDIIPTCMKEEKRETAFKRREKENTLPWHFRCICIKPVPKCIDPVFAKTSPQHPFSLIETSVLGLFLRKLSL